MEWVRHLITERNKSIEVAFIMLVDRMGYGWLRCLYFEKELPKEIISKTDMTLRLVDGLKECVIDLMEEKENLSTSTKETYFQLGKKLGAFFK